MTCSAKLLAERKGKVSIERDLSPSSQGRNLTSVERLAVPLVFLGLHIVPMARTFCNAYFFSVWAI